MCRDNVVKDKTLTADGICWDTLHPQSDRPPSPFISNPGGEDAGGPAPGHAGEA